MTISLSNPAKYFKRKPEAVHVYPDGRERCEDNAAGKREYYRRTRVLSARQGEICAICNRFLIMPTFDHQDGRGMAGAIRDDRTEVDGNWLNAALCWQCNVTKGSRKFHWVDGKYEEQS